MSERAVLLNECECDWEWDEGPRGETCVRWRTLISADKTPSCGVTTGICIVPPGGELAPHHHAPQEAYYAIEGSAEIHLDGGWRPIERGDAAYIPGGVTHGVRNRSDRPFVLMWTFPTDTLAEIEYIDG